MGKTLRSRKIGKAMTANQQQLLSRLSELKNNCDVAGWKSSFVFRNLIHQSARSSHAESFVKRAFFALLLFMWILPIKLGWANPAITVQAELESDHVEVGESVRFIVEVQKTGRGDLPEPRLPDFGALGISYEGPSIRFSSGFSSINGQVTSTQSQSYFYLLTPSRPGRFELPIDVMDGGQQVSVSKTPVLEVTGTASEAEPSSEDGSVGKPTRASADVFVWPRLAKASVYVGEQLTFVIEVYTKRRLADLSWRTLPQFKDFWSEDLPEGKNREEIIDGQYYSVVPGHRWALFPQRAGTLTIQGAQVVESLMTFFGPSRQRVFSAPPVKVEVLPLPAKGQPTNFSPNNVGEFTIETSVDRNEVEVGEAFTLKVVIKGTGNLKAIDPGAWPKLEGLRRYEPKVDTQVSIGAKVGGSRTYEFLIIPEKAGRLIIPAHEFTFFNPEQEGYETVASQELFIEVKQGANTDVSSLPESPTTATQTDANEAEEASLLAPIISASHVPRTEALTFAWLTPQRWLYGILAVPSLLLLGLIGRLVWRRWGPGEEARAQAARLARQQQRIAEAQASLTSDASGQKFYGAIAHILQDVAIATAGPAGHGLPRSELLKLLKQQGVDQAAIQELDHLLNRSDAARFSSSFAHESAAERQAILNQVLRLVSIFSQHSNRS